jgi:DNA-3-methyladenine glycosylase
MPVSPLPAQFYQHPVQKVARDLLGARLVRVLEEGQVSGFITETEAYAGEQDLACHARAGRTPRTEVMYGPPGRAYVYFIYGIHWMLNVVAEPVDFPAAVLIRAMLPETGLEIIARRRPAARQRDWTNGPARLCMALDIDGSCNGVDLTSPQSPLRMEPGVSVPDEAVLTGPRVGIQGVPEPWRSQPWRYRVSLQSWNPASIRNGV